MIFEIALGRNQTLVVTDLYYKYCVYRMNAVSSHNKCSSSGISVLFFVAIKFVVR